MNFEGPGVECCGFNVKCPSLVHVFDPQLTTLFWKVVGPLGGKASLEEVGY